MPYFRGFSKSIITYDEKKLQWLLKSDKNDVIGTAYAPLEPMGLGEILWQFNINICNPDNDSEPMKAVMTTCLVNLFKMIIEQFFWWGQNEKRPPPSNKNFDFSTYFAKKITFPRNLCLTLQYPFGSSKWQWW